MAFILTKNNENTKYGVIEGYVETTSEIASLNTSYAPGSEVVAIDSGETYVLTTGKQWALKGKF